MKKYKHLTSNDRSIIQQGLTERKSFKWIAREINKDPSTISKEVRNHLQFNQTGCYGRTFNDCFFRHSCEEQYLCGNIRCHRHCKFCKTHPCSKRCSEYKQEICNKLSKPPYVCNGCKSRNKCTLEKRYYTASEAQKEYEKVRSESRQGIQLTELEALRLDNIISPLIKKGQSLHHIFANHADEIMFHKRSLYNPNYSPS